MSIFPRFIYRGVCGDHSSKQKNITDQNDAGTSWFLCPLSFSLSLSHTSPVQFGCILAVIVLYCMYIYIVMNEDRKVRKEMAAREVEDACGGEVGGTLKQRC